MKPNTDIEISYTVKTQEGTYLGEADIMDAEERVKMKRGASEMDKLTVVMGPKVLRRKRDTMHISPSFVLYSDTSNNNGVNVVIISLLNKNLQCLLRTTPTSLTWSCTRTSIRWWRGSGLWRAASLRSTP